MKYIDALKKYNEGKDKWCMPRKGSEDYLNIIKMVKKVSKIKKNKGVNDKKDSIGNNSKSKNADSKIRILQAAIKRKLAIHKNNSNVISNIKASISKISKKPSYNSNSRIFSNDILKNMKIKKIQRFLRDKLVVNKHTLINRINRFNLLKKQLELLKDNDCLEKKTFNSVNGYTIRNIINLEKKMGSKSKHGTIYLTSIPNFISKYPIATKLMKYNNDNIAEVNIMRMITKNILLKKISRHFLMIYGSCACTKRIAERFRLISINELADGDLKMLVNIRDIVANYELLFNIFFQTFISIASFHNLTGFVHKDAHYGNFLYQINNERGYYHYICNGKDYYLKSCKYNIIIYDYGFSKKINENMNNNLIVKRESRYVFEDYSRILHAFMNKKTGWGKYDNLPNDRINDIIMNINNILNNNIYLELTSNVTNNIPYSKRIINDIIKDVFLKYTPRDMFITIRPQNVLNEIPFSID
jgi:hypothetical protein